MPKERPSSLVVDSFEVDLFELPDPARPQLKEIMFNSELSREIRSRYVDQFGSVDTETLIYRNTRYAEMADKAPDQSSFDATRAQRKQFGEYIIKRLVEWHADKQMKETPELQRAYEVKQAISQVALPVTKETKIEINISIAGDTIDIIYENPYVDSKYIVDLIRAENRFLMSKPIDKKTQVQTEILEKDGIASIEVRKVIALNTTAGIKESSWYNPIGITPRETRTSLLFARTF